MLISQCLHQGSQRLENLSDSPRLDAEVLLAHSLQKTRTWLATWPDTPLQAAQLAQFQQLIDKRCAGHPVAHITGHREFWSLDLLVNENTLIPRPDTELMVEQILQHYPQYENIQLVDPGTGSGAIALAIASERPHWKIFATDQCPLALQIAQQNAQNLQLTQIEFRQGNWLEAVTGLKFDIIACNPPYIPLSDPHLQQGDIRFEPSHALASGADGLDDIRLITAQARTCLKPAGRLFIEHGYDQKQKILDIFIENTYKEVIQLMDLSQNPRLTTGIID
ncbi:Peptide chain release factor N(5)-glutamine methyltransferase [hydrothermal vent metagenome]|uniref:Peptide chain release factor N(5)-glutamine methyltransferase n=1 Tax=hydrothermal vent metagenome TaxID=652676 RepID=A0A3B0XWD4_9ZZZZ